MSTSHSSEEKFPTTSGKRKPACWTFFLVALVVTLIDLGSKTAAVEFLYPERPVRLLGGALWLVLVRNSGAAFSLATQYTWALTGIAIIAVIVIIRISRALVSRWWALGLGMILGGAVGNLLDRIFRAPGFFQGRVVDFLSLFSDHGAGWAVFNIADSAICTGAALMVVLSFMGVDHSEHSPSVTEKKL